MTQIKDPEAARRLARAIASDIALYNEEKIKKGIQEDTFFDVLEKELEEGRTHYESKIDVGIRKETNYFDRAIVDVILKRKGHIQSKIW